MLATAALGVGLSVTLPTHAASLQQIDQSVWWQGVTDLPSYVNMFLYVPDQLASSPPVVVAPHHCQGDGPGTFSEMASLVTLADQRGFIMIFPEATGQNCWDAGSDRSLKHDGKGDTQAIVQMVRYTLASVGGNAERVYSVGGSSGGIMTEALLGVYPDVFMAGVSLMGVPCGCWAEGYNDVVGKPSDGTGQWSGPCSGGDVHKSAEEWGDLVRTYFPGYTGHRPRLQHWHGTADTVLDYANLAEDIKQWTNVLGLSEEPTGSDTPESGTTRQYWTNACGYTIYETFSLSGVGHSVPFNGNAVAEYFGLDDPEGPDPEAAACPGTGGDTGSGGGGGGVTSVENASVSNVGGAAGTTGTDAGSTEGGGASSAGGPTASQTASSTSGSSPATSSSSANAATITTASVGGTMTTADANTNTMGLGASVGHASGSPGAAPVDDGGGCSCGIVGTVRHSGPHSFALLVTALGLTLGRRRYAC
ncbi:MAG TPA: PHB depolymerase family esterase [Polyangiaceae bacterium]